MSAPGRSRAAAVALLVGVVSLAGAAVIAPAAMLWTGRGDDIREERMKILRAEDRDRSREKLAGQGEAWRGFADDPSSGFVRAGSDEAAITALRSRIEAGFAAAGGTLRTLAAEAAPAGRGGVTKIALELRGIVPQKKLGPFLASLESEAPFVIIETFRATQDSGNRLSLTIGGGAYRLERDAQ